jgi:hypothetical protein
MSEMNRREFGRTTAAGLAAFALPQTSPATTKSYRYIHLDVFTDRKLAGNQLFVFVEPAGLDVDTMQAFTRESNRFGLGHGPAEAGRHD